MTEESAFSYGVFFAVLPIQPSISPSTLKETCEEIKGQFSFGLEWTHHREPSLTHPQLSQPLKFLEISGKLTIHSEAEEKVAENLCNEIISTLTKKESIVGNVELMLILPNSPIPLMDLKLPEDESVSTFEDYGIMVMRNALQETGAMYDLVVETFQKMYTAMQAKSGKYYKEIMQRDDNRFDFRLDLDADDTWKKFEENGKWKDLVSKILGDGFSLVKCGCVLSLPGTKMQYYHSDGVHVGASASFESDEVQPTHALCVFIPLIDLNQTTGYTEFWAGSHKYNNLLQKKGMHALPGGHDGTISRGDCLLYDYRVIHRGMPNESKYGRPICYFLYSKEGMEHVEDQNFVPESVFD